VRIGGLWGKGVTKLSNVIAIVKNENAVKVKLLEFGKVFLSNLRFSFHCESLFIFLFVPQTWILNCLKLLCWLLLISMLMLMLINVNNCFPLLMYIFTWVLILVNELVMFIWYTDDVKNVHLDVNIRWW
jgi:hypothetical protein